MLLFCHINIISDKMMSHICKEELRKNDFV